MKSEVKKEIADEVVRRQLTPPAQRPSLKEEVNSDLESLRMTGIVSQFFNRSVKIITPAPRSQRSPVQEEFPPPVEELPVEETPVEETPVEETPSEELPVEEKV